MPKILVQLGSTGSGDIYLYRYFRNSWSLGPEQVLTGTSMYNKSSQPFDGVVYGNGGVCGGGGGITSFSVVDHVRAYLYLYNFSIKQCDGVVLRGLVWGLVSTSVNIYPITPPTPHEYIYRRC